MIPVDAIIPIDSAASSRGSSSTVLVEEDTGSISSVLESLSFDERVGKFDENACELPQEASIDQDMQRVDDEVRRAYC
jgi:hypothetical protein